MSLQRRKLKVKCLQKKKKELDIKKKNKQCIKKISEILGPLTEDVDFACMDVTDSDSDDNTSDISTNAMQ